MSTNYKALLAMNVVAYCSVDQHFPSDEAAAEHFKRHVRGGFEGLNQPFRLNWDAAEQHRVVLLSNAEGKEVLCDWMEESPSSDCSAPPAALRDELTALCKQLREGVDADIWYDARDHGDQAKEAVIDATQDAMEDAIRLLTQWRDRLPVPQSTSEQTAPLMTA